MTITKEVKVRKPRFKRGLNDTAKTIKVRLSQNMEYEKPVVPKRKKDKLNSTVDTVKAKAVSAFDNTGFRGWGISVYTPMEKVIMVNKIDVKLLE